MEKAIPIQQAGNKKFKAPSAENLTEEEKKKKGEEEAKQRRREEERRSPDESPVRSPEGVDTNRHDTALALGVIPAPPTGEVAPAGMGTRLETPSATALLPGGAPEVPPAATVSDPGARMNLSVEAASGTGPGVRPGARISEAGRISAPTARPDPGSETGTVRLCSESLRRATQWCDSTVERRM